MVAKKTINQTDLARILHEKHPDILIRDLSQILKDYEYIVADELSKDNKVKLGKLLELDVSIKEGRMHYDGIDKIHGGKGKYIKIPDRKRVKYTPMKLIKDIQNKDIK